MNKYAIIEAIRPTREEQKNLHSIQNLVMASLENQFVDEIMDMDVLDIIPVGSLPKDTNIRGSSDIDVFVKFSPLYPEDLFKTVVHEKIKKALEGFGAVTETNYASHPYVKAKYKGVDIDVAPCYHVKLGEVRSAVDRTPYHTEYVIKNLKGGQTNEVRLLKQYLKASELYGANEKVQGFSGYLCELLIIKYGSFIDVLESELKDYLDKDDPNTPIHLSDPVDKNRNVAAALSWDSYLKFIFHVRLDIDLYKKSKKFSSLGFNHVPQTNEYKKDIFMNEAKHIGSKLYSIKYDNLSDNEEVLHSTARKNLKKMVKKIERYDFNVFDSMFLISPKETELLIQIENNVLPKDKKVEGPPIDVSKESFIKWIDSDGSVFIENGKFYKKRDRKYRFVHDLIEEEYPNVQKIVG